ncbi:MAG: winged helix-turn-helix transcriptional regulator [Saprospiraceae bacterium]|nr:winged helix-turn-helix transcriptional regulator [Saprospiraceae bacterium]
MIVRRDIFQAIADPTRRAIILLLATGSMTPNALAEHFDTSRQAVSRHLQILSECEIVTARQSGREMIYEVNSEKMKDIEKWIEQFKAIMAKRFDQLDEVLAMLKRNKK